MSHKPLSQTPDASDCWLALRYLTGDLEETEWAAFDDRLALDTGLQEALAETVKLTTGVAQVDRRTTRVSGRPSRVSMQTQPFPQSMGGKAVALASAVVGLMALGLLIRPTSPISVGLIPSNNDESMRYVASADVPVVVSLWSSLATDEIVAGDPFATSETSPMDGSMDDELNVPNWLLLAVGEESRDGTAAEFPADESL